MDLKYLNVVDTIEMDSYTIYYVPKKGTNKTSILCQPKDNTNVFLLGDIYMDKDNGIYQSLILNNEAVCIVNETNGNKTIKRLFYIPKLAFIEGSNELSEEYYSLLFSSNLNENKLLSEIHANRHNIFR
ncbi:MAG: hypothetical protein E7163_03365 [Firmicutes bacterium]|nr:hypothetical protein [Bacillota bacterium]